MKSTVPSLTLTVDAAAEMLNISRHSAYAAVARGELPSLKIGKRLLIPRAALEKLLSIPNPENPSE